MSVLTVVSPTPGRLAARPRSSLVPTAVPISPVPLRRGPRHVGPGRHDSSPIRSGSDRKSTRLNSSHVAISYAVFCLKKKKKKDRQLNSHEQLECHVG